MVYFEVRYLNLGPTYNDPISTPNSIQYRGVDLQYRLNCATVNGSIFLVNSIVRKQEKNEINKKL